MVRFENDCVDCGLPCLGDSCKYRHVRHLYCDKCCSEIDKLFVVFEDKQWCEECIIEHVFNKLEVIE